MDALKKAEQAKRQAEAGTRPLDLELDAEEPAGRMEPAASGAADSALPPDLQSKIDLLDDDLSEHRRGDSADADDFKFAGAPEDRERATVRKVFEVKAAPTRAGFYWTVGGLTLFAIIALGALFWWQLQQSASSLAPPPLAVAPATPIIEPPPAAGSPAPPAPPAAASATEAPAPQPSTPEAPPVATAAASAGPDPGAAPSVRALPRQPPGTTTRRPSADAARRTTTRDRLAGEALAAAPQEPAIPIKPGGPRLAVSPDIARAYENYLSGDLAAARTAYEQALRRNPRQADALHGLAAISLREGRPEAADAYHARALEADPTDAYALAGLVALRGQTDPTLAESRLKTTLSTQPGAHSAHFALGNLYAKQGRWGEAQQAYFRAHTGDADNPDYSFNLAVSLDQLRQPKLALQHYQQALVAAEARPAAFDRAQVAARIADLQQ